MSVAMQDRSSGAQASAFARTDDYYRLRADIEDFLYVEADLLDERRYREWLDLLA